MNIKYCYSVAQKVLIKTMFFKSVLYNELKIPRSFLTKSITIDNRQLTQYVEYL